MLSGPAQAGLATHEPHVWAACAGPLKANRVSLKPGVRSRMCGRICGSCVAGLTVHALALSCPQAVSRK